MPNCQKKKCNHDNISRLRGQHDAGHRYTGGVAVIYTHNDSKARRSIAQRHTIRINSRSVLHYVVCDDGTRWEYAAFCKAHKRPQSGRPPRVALGLAGPLNEVTGLTVQERTEFVERPQVD